MGIGQILTKPPFFASNANYPSRSRQSPGSGSPA